MKQEMDRLIRVKEYENQVQNEKNNYKECKTFKKDLKVLRE